MDDENDEVRWDARTVALVWEDARPNVPGIEGMVRKSLHEELDGLGEPSDLIYHSIWLDGDPEGRTVTAWGVEGSEAIHLAYSEKPEWVTLRP